MKNLYQPDSQATARFGVTPFQRIEIPIGQNGSQDGIFIPTIEGTGLLVERADYPVILSLVTLGNTADNGYPAIPGLQLAVTFKGIYISYPPYTPLIPTKAVLSLIVFRGSDMKNELSDNTWNGLLSIRQINNTAILQTIGIHVPMGMRYLRHLLVAPVSATTTQATCTIISKYNTSGPAIGATANNLAYPVGSVLGPFPMNSLPALGAGTANPLLELRDIPLPSDTIEIQVNVVGTVMSALTAVACAMT